MEEIVVPNRYTGYDEDGEVVITISAKNANTLVNPNTVKRKIEKFQEEVNEGFKEIKKALLDIPADKETLLFDNKTLEPLIAELAEQIGGNKEAIAPLAEKMYNLLYENVYLYALKTHNQVQKKYNQNARNACKITGVTRVVEKEIATSDGSNISPGIKYEFVQL